MCLKDFADPYANQMVGDDVAVMCSVSLFSGGGVGDLGVHDGAGVPVIACAELVPKRAALLRRFFPGASVHEGDLRDTNEALVQGVRARLDGRRPLLVVMSPPCQGMSANGAGRIASSIKNGTRPVVDQRNRLILPALDVVDALTPDVVILENVKRMMTTTILNERNDPENAIALFRRRLAAYRIEIKVVDFASLGVPQRRVRLIGIATRDSRAAHIPLHCPLDNRHHVSFAAATRHLPPLDALDGRDDPDDVFHTVPAWSEHQHFCMRCTPEGETAFDNLTCVACGALNTKLDVACAGCAALLPRPSFVRETRHCVGCGASVSPPKKCPCGHGETAVSETRQLVRAFRTAYRRMHGDRPASTLTTNSGVISSDIKGHPSEHRVLSLREVLIVATVSSRPGFDAPWWPRVEAVFAGLPPKELRDVLGESIPPLAMARLVGHLLAHRDTQPANLPPPVVY